MECVQPEREPFPTSPMTHMGYYRPGWGEQEQRELEDGGQTVSLGTKVEG